MSSSEKTERLCSQGEVPRSLRRSRINRPLSDSAPALLPPTAFALWFRGFQGWKGRCGVGWRAGRGAGLSLSERFLRAPGGRPPRLRLALRHAEERAHLCALGVLGWIALLVASPCYGGFGASLVASGKVADL